MAVDRFVLLVLQNEASRIKTLFRERSRSVVGFAWTLAILLSFYITWSDQHFGTCETGDTAIEGGNGTCAYLELKYGHSIAPIINKNCSVDTLPNLCLDALPNFNFTDYENDYDYGPEKTIKINQNEDLNEDSWGHYDLIYIGSMILLLVAPTLILPFAYAMIVLRVRSSAEITHNTPSSGLHHVNKLIKMVFIIIGKRL